jgi:AcrR family transcriptional regulator
MARKTTYTAADVAQAALAVLAAEGTQAVTARRVAAALGASTAPVYSNFASMEDLLEAVRRLIVDLILDYCRRPWATDSFLSMGLGFVHFASEWPQLFRAVYLEPASTGLVEHDVLPELLEDLARHPGLGALPRDHQEELLFQASIYTLGIATTVVTGRWEDPDFASIEGWLRSVGGLLARAALTAAGLPIPVEMDQSLGKFTVPWRQPGCPAAKDGNHD